MKRPTWLAMFVVVSALTGVGVIGAYSFSSSSMPTGETHGASISNPVGMLGHITLTTYDPAGKIIGYLQTDNTIVNVGENCVAEAMFNVTTSGSSACTGPGLSGANVGGFRDGGFRFITIGNGTSGVDDSNANQTSLNNPYTGTVLMLTQEDTTPSITKADGLGATSAVVTVDADFTAGTAGSIVNESGLFDADGGNMLARQGFANVTLGVGDTLTVEWEITIGG